MIAEDTAKVMRKAAVSQSEVVSPNIPREPADFESLTEEEKGLVMMIRAIKEKRAERRDIDNSIEKWNQEKGNERG